MFSFVSNLSVVAVVDLNTLKSIFRVLKKSKIHYSFKTRETIFSKENIYYSPVYSVADEKKVALLKKLLDKGEYVVARAKIVRQLSVTPYDYYLHYLVGESFRGSSLRRGCLRVVAW